MYPAFQTPRPAYTVYLIQAWTVPKGYGQLFLPLVMLMCKFIWLFFSLLFRDRVLCTTASLELLLYSRMTLNSWLSFLHLLNAGTKGQYLHTRLLQPLCPWAVLMALSRESVLKATGMGTGAGEWNGRGSCGDSDLLVLRVGRITR